MMEMDQAFVNFSVKTRRALREESPELGADAVQERCRELWGQLDVAGKAKYEAPATCSYCDDLEGSPLLLTLSPLAWGEDGRRLTLLPTLSLLASRGHAGAANEGPAEPRLASPRSGLARRKLTPHGDRDDALARNGRDSKSSWSTMPGGELESDSLAKFCR